MILKLCRDVQLFDGSLSSFRSAVNVRHLSFVVLIAALIVCISASPSPAAPINYGDHVGNSVTYKMVTEDSATDPTPLFGPPLVTGDSMDFNPVGFDASTSGANGVDITDGQLVFMVQAKSGKAIQNIKFTEFGDTTLAGIGTDATSTLVRMPVVIDIVEVDGVGISAIKLNAMSVPPIITSFAPSGGDYGLGTDGGGGPFYHTTWMGMLFVDLQQVLIDKHVPFLLGITKINVNLDNVLVATSQAGTSSLIAKKDHFIITTNIPEPATCSLVMIALAGGALLARRGRP